MGVCDKSQKRKAEYTYTIIVWFSLIVTAARSSGNYTVPVLQNSNEHVVCRLGLWLAQETSNMTKSYKSF